jgi:hypothetical protein
VLQYVPFENMTDGDLLGGCSSFALLTAHYTACFRGDRIRGGGWFIAQYRDQ